MPPLDLYYFPPSPPSRVVLLVARALGLDMNLKEVNILNGEHLTVEYIKINPQHIIPTLNDDGFTLWESRAIICYLTDMHSENDTLYPKDPKGRAIVNQRLYFDAGTLYQRLADYYMPVIFRGEPANDEQWKKVEEAFGFLDMFLEGQDWVAGDNMTIADHSIAVTASNAEAMGLVLDNFPNVARWYRNAKDNMDGFEELNQAGANAMGEMFQARISAQN